ncbi:hypothetical protein T484DRAFT_1979344 [Baffinella frigidus]|nr:hypothetical protein T484DRAFT_1979344 [Cryptophyta sp. CCMP2293]
MVFGVLMDAAPPPPPAGQCYVMTFPLKYGLPPMCVEGQTPDSPAHVGMVFAHLVKVQQERKMMEFKSNGASSLASRWDKRMGQ